MGYGCSLRLHIWGLPTGVVTVRISMSSYLPLHVAEKKTTRSRATHHTATRTIRRATIRYFKPSLTPSMRPHPQHHKSPNTTYSPQPIIHTSLRPSVEKPRRLATHPHTSYSFSNQHLKHHQLSFFSVDVIPPNNTQHPIYNPQSRTQPLNPTLKAINLIRIVFSILVHPWRSAALR
jgi:hypothetical protein